MNLDDRLREAIHDAFPPAKPRDGLADEIIKAASRPAPGPGLGGAGMWIAIGVVAAAILGAVLGLSARGGAPAPAVVGLDGVAVYACPGDGQVGTLHRGDRIFITGRTADGSWLSVRNVRGSGQAVFIRASHVVEDSDVAHLPERDCDDHGILVVGSPPPTTAPPSTVPETTTTIPDTTTIPAPTTTVPAPTTTVPAPTTTVPDTTAPRISNTSAVPEVIWEEDTDFISCPPNTPRESIISATVTDNVAVASVTASWTDPSGTQTVPMAGGVTRTTVFGPYEADTWDPFPWEPGFEHQVTITITAKDAVGNTAAAQVEVTVTEVGTCFI
ncbi:MAG: hypothetical protein R2823_02935 [Acidimicrobiia bacterium]